MPERIRLRDLAVPQGQPQHSQVVDDFEPNQLRLPNLQPVADFVRIADGINNLMDGAEEASRKKLHDAAVDWDAKNAGSMETLLDRAHAAGRGLEGDEKAQAHSNVLREMKEEGLIPASANPGWLRVYSDLEAQRMFTNFNARLGGSLGELSSLVDEDGNLSDQGNAETHFDEEWANMMASPLFNQSESATRLAGDSQEQMREAFLNEIHKRRSVNQEERSDQLKIGAVVTGISHNGVPISRGTAALQDPTLTGDELSEVIHGIEAGQAHYRATGESNDLFKTGTLNQISALIDNGQPEAAQRVINRLYAMVTVPDGKGGGLTLDEDPNYSKDFGALLSKAEKASRQKAYEESQHLAGYDSAARQQFNGHYALALREGLTGDAAVDAAIESLEGSREYQSLLVRSGLDATPGYATGTFITEANRQESDSRRYGAQAGADELAKIMLGLTRGEYDKDQAKELGIAANLPPELQQQIEEDTATVNWAEATNHPVFATRAESIKAAMTISGAGKGSAQRLIDANGAADLQKQQLIDAGINEGQKVPEIMKSQEYRSIEERLDNTIKNEEESVKTAREFLDESKARGDTEDIRLAAANAKGLVDERVLRDELEAAARLDRNFDNNLRNDNANRFPLRNIDALVTFRQLAAGITDEDALSVEGPSGFIDKYFDLVLAGREEIEDLQPAKQAAAWEALRRKSYQTIRDELLTPEQRSIVKATDPETFKTWTVAQGDKERVATLTGGGSWKDLNDGLKTEAMLDHTEVIPTFSSWNNSQVAIAVDRELSSDFIKELADTGAVGADEVTTVFIGRSATNGRFTPEDVMNGEAELTASTREFGVESRYGDALKDHGWAVTALFQHRGRGGSVESEYRKTVTLEDLPPYSTLLFRGTRETSGASKLKAWMSSTSDAAREALYRKMGRAFVDLESADTEFRKQQTDLLNRFDHD